MSIEEYIFTNAKKKKKKNQNTFLMLLLRTCLFSRGKQIPLSVFVKSSDVG